MASKIRRMAVVGGAAFAPLAIGMVMTPGVSGAVECGWGTVFDPPSNSCVAAPAPPAWNGDITPYFGVGVCVPIPVPFAPSVCGGI